MEKSKFDGRLHLYAQSSEHDDAYIVGDIEGLNRLKSAIERCLQQIEHPGTSGTVNTFTSDGEGFTAHVIVLASERMSNLQLPYAREKCVKGRYPSSLIPDVPLKLCQFAIAYPDVKEGWQLSDQEWFEVQRKLGFDYEKAIPVHDSFTDAHDSCKSEKEEK